jgi:hypothetical protein
MHGAAPSCHEARSHTTTVTWHYDPQRRDLVER